jgi:hypothetical protein
MHGFPAGSLVVDVRSNRKGVARKEYTDENAGPGSRPLPLVDVDFGDGQPVPVAPEFLRLDEPADFNFRE